MSMRFIQILVGSSVEKMPPVKHRRHSEVIPPGKQYTI